MIEASVRIHIARNPEDTFAFFVDLRNEPVYNAQVRRITKTSSGPIGPGTSFEGEHIGFGRVTWRLREFEAPRHVVIEGEVGASPYRWVADFAPSGDGTDMIGRMQWEPRGVWRALGPLARVLLAFNARRAFGRLRDTLEQSDPSRGGAAPAPHG